MKRLEHLDEVEGEIYRQIFQLEANDVGAMKQHYKGYDQGKYQIRESDIGRNIEVLSSGLHQSKKGIVQYTCWTFVE